MFIYSIPPALPTPRWCSTDWADAAKEIIQIDLRFAGQDRDRPPDLEPLTEESGGPTPSATSASNPLDA
jgi:hypothetical protein